MKTLIRSLAFTLRGRLAVPKHAGPCSDNKRWVEILLGIGFGKSWLTLGQFGRVIYTASPAGLYGNMGQASYSAAKSTFARPPTEPYTDPLEVGLLALSKTMALEGVKYNIKANTIVPVGPFRYQNDKHC